MSATIESLNPATFDEQIAASDLPVLVDVWAEWCPPCKALEPVLASIAEDHRDGLRIFKFSGDDHPELAARLGVMAFPTMLGFRDGELVQRIVGAKGKGQLLAELAELIG